VSQHIYLQDGTEVRMGYDRPLDYVFCTITVNDEIKYCNLDDETAGTFQQDVDYYRDILALHHIEVPEEMFADVRDDQKNCVGNRVKVHKGVVPNASN